MPTSPTTRMIEHLRRTVLREGAGLGDGELLGRFLERHDEAAAEAGRPLPGHADRLRAAARDFDDVTYGGRRATEQAYHRITELDRDLERTKPRLATTSHNTAPHTRPGAAE